MESFKPGLFVGGDDVDIPEDNLALERWFKNLKKPRKAHSRASTRWHAHRPRRPHNNTRPGRSLVALACFFPAGATTLSRRANAADPEGGHPSAKDHAKGSIEEEAETLAEGFRRKVLG